MTLRDLVDRWRVRAQELERFAPAAAVAFLECAGEADELARTERTAIVSLREAALIGGYSIDHLQRLVASGEIENVGKKGRPRIRRSDIPIKPGHSLHTGEDGGQLSARRRIVASARDTNPRRA